MVNSTSNDNEFSDDLPPINEANGQAALLLVESLIHSLIEQDVIRVAHAVDAIESATQIARLLHETPPPYRAPHTLLGAIQTSLSREQHVDC
jgi:hypothetical protein